MAKIDADTYLEVYADLPGDGLPDLWGWQKDVLRQLGGLDRGDVAVELPTGTGKTAIALLVAHEHRARRHAPVVYLCGTRQLARYVGAEAERLGVPAHVFEDKKRDWDANAVMDVEFGDAIGIMNYWNYFNEQPGVKPADLLVMDDVHLAEGPLRDFFTVNVPLDDPICAAFLERVRTRFPYYGLVEDLLEGLDPRVPAEMISPIDAIELAEDVRPLFDDPDGLEDGSDAWWAWQRIRRVAEVCCWLISPRGISITPWSPPSRLIPHFEKPKRRLYMSATVGDVEDLRRRIGAGRLRKVTAEAEARQGERYVAFLAEPGGRTPAETVEELAPLLDETGKAVWLCARKGTADLLTAALEEADRGPVLRQRRRNHAVEDFADASSGQLVTTGRYDGMDFPGDACRLEVLPETPVVISDLEEFVSSYLRDADFAAARFVQRVAQALGRCNREPDDRAVYLLWDPEFAKIRSPQALGALPAELREEVYGGMRLSGGPGAAIEGAVEFLRGAEGTSLELPRQPIEPPEALPAGKELAGVLRAFEEDYSAAAQAYGKAAAKAGDHREYRAFWLAMQAAMLELAHSRHGDRAAGREVRTVLDEALETATANSFFSRLRASKARLEGRRQQVDTVAETHDRLFAAWDREIDVYGTRSRLERRTTALLDDLAGQHHDSIARAVVDLGRLLGLTASAPEAQEGEPDAIWDLANPRRRIVWEVKTAPKRAEVVIDDVTQAEGACTASSDGDEVEVRGLLLTPHDAIRPRAEQRLRHVRLVRQDLLVGWAGALLDLLRLYARGWSSSADDRAAQRANLEPRVLSAEDFWSLVADGDGTWLTFD